MKRLGAGLSLLLLCGCLVPQEIEEMEPPRVGNDAPRIVLRAPDTQRVVTQWLCDAPVTFQLIGVEDFDRGDALEVRWFVDYGPDDATPEASMEIPASPDLVNGVRPNSTVTFQIDPRDIGPGRTVVVEAVVSDGFDPAPAAEPLNRAVLPEKDADSTSWLLTVTAEPACL